MNDDQKRAEAEARAEADAAYYEEALTTRVEAIITNRITSGPTTEHTDAFEGAYIERIYEDVLSGFDIAVDVVDMFPAGKPLERKEESP